MAYSSVISVPVIRSAEKFQDLPYLVGFAAVGLFFSLLAIALTGAEWLA